MRLHHYIFALCLSSLPVICSAVPVKGADRTSVEYQAIEEISDSYEHFISLDQQTVKKPTKSLKQLIQGSSSSIDEKNSAAGLFRLQKGKKSKSKQEKQKTEQELFDEFLATDALTGQLAEKKKRSAFSTDSTLNNTENNEDSSTSPKIKLPNNQPSRPRVSEYFIEKFASNTELYGAFKQGKSYFNEQKQMGANILKQYNIEFSGKATHKHGILEQAAKQRPHSETVIDHSDIENSILMQAINFATSWKGITLAVIFGLIYVILSAVSNRAR